MSQAIGKASMIPRQQGRIINVASIAGLAGNRADMKMIAYNTSKGAVVNFTRALAGEWGKHGINVNALAPGFFPSKMTKGMLAAVRRRQHGQPRAAAAPRRRRRPEGRGAAVRVGRRQAHHRADPRGRRRRVGDPSRPEAAPVSLPFPKAIPFVEILGFEFVGWGDGEAEIAIELRDDLSNSWSVAHGGVSMTLLDVVMAHAARSVERRRRRELARASSPSR